MIPQYSDFCPAPDQETLLRFRSDAYQAWVTAPADQKDFWQREYRHICDLLESAKSGHDRLG
jgi:hypothetical protein